MKTISDHMLDIVQNSIRAGATLIEVMVEDQKKSDFYHLRIKDNGFGMTSDIAQQAVSPFFTSRSTRKVGLGLPLLKQNAEAAGGDFQLISESGEGTEVTARFQRSHIDRPPVGDFWGTWVLLLAGNPGIRLVLAYQTDEGLFRLDSDELQWMFSGIGLQRKEIMDAIIELIKNNLMEIGASN